MVKKRCIRDEAGFFPRWTDRVISPLLKNGAAMATEAVSGYKAPYPNREAFFVQKAALTREYEAVTYRKDGAIVPNP